MHVQAGKKEHRIGITTHRSFLNQLLGDLEFILIVVGVVKDQAFDEKSFNVPSLYMLIDEVFWLCHEAIGCCDSNEISGEPISFADFS